MQVGRLVAVALASLLLVACAPAARHDVLVPLTYGTEYVVGGHVMGLRGIGLTLRDARGAEIKVDDDGRFVFGSRLENGSEYSVQIAREPISPVQTCFVDHGTGKIDGRNAMDLLVLCTTAFEDEQKRAGL
jgi:hypothetical protein